MVAERGRPDRHRRQCADDVARRLGFSLLGICDHFHLSSLRQWTVRKRIVMVTGVRGSADHPVRFRLSPPVFRSG